MATRCAAASTNWTTSTTWATIDATSFNNSESANTALTTSFVESTGATTGAITVDAILVKIASRAASPTGTMTVHLAIAGVEVVGTAVTVNVSDIPTCTATTGTTSPVGTAEGGWFCCKFAAPVLLTATSYTVGAKTSSATQVNLWSSATTNWSRALRTTTTANMAAGDDAIITKEWTAAGTGTARTVTMDETATTDYGGNTTSQVTPSLAITQGGTLSFSTSIAANLRQSGYVIVYNGGTLNIGASGAEVARGSTAVLQFDCAADGDFGLVARLGATVRMAGLSRTSGKIVSMCKLNADASASATSITIDTDTGWLSGDVVCLAPTTRTSTQFESKALTGNATATTAAITALTNAHSGTSPTQAEVGLLTRNVQVAAVTANVVTFFYIGTTATVSCSWTDFRYLSTDVTGKRGLDISTTTGSVTIDYCCVRDSDSAAIQLNGAAVNNFTITNTVCYNSNLAGASPGMFTIPQTTGTSWTVSNNMFCGAATSGGISMININDLGGTFTNNSISGSNGNASPALVLSGSNEVIGTFSGITVHSNASDGLGITQRTSGTMGTINTWRNTGFGLSFGSSQTIGTKLTVSTGNSFGNTSAGILVSGSGLNLVLDTVTTNGDTTFSQPDGIRFIGGNLVLYMANCQFSVVAGIKTKNSNDFNFNSATNSALNIVAESCIFNATTIIANPEGITYTGRPFLQMQNFGQVANANRSYFASGTGTPGLVLSSSSTVYSPNVLSEQMTPALTTAKLVSNSIFVECDSGKAATPVVQVQKNGTYNGNAPRLIVKRQDSIGVTSDTVLATFSASANTWQALTGTTVVASQTGVFEFVVDCDGTAGSVFVGDATATTA